MGDRMFPSGREHLPRLATRWGAPRPGAERGRGATDADDRRNTDGDVRQRGPWGKDYSLFVAGRDRRRVADWYTEGPFGEFDSVRGAPGR